MPATYNLPRTQNLWSIQDTELYQKLPYYLANLESKYFPKWNVWNKLLGTKPWQKNEGTTMRGVRAEPTPIGRQLFVPNPITQAPLKDRMEVREVFEEAIVRRHLYESPYFHFLPSFQDFRKNQIGFAMKDLAAQIMCANDFFIRTAMFYYSPYIFICGKSADSLGQELIGAPTIGNTGGLYENAAKDANWLKSVIPLIGTSKGNLSLKACNLAGQIMREDLQAPPWEGMVNTPTDNETIKGKYLIVGSNEAFANFTFDEHLLAYKPSELNIVNDEFSGVLFGFIAYKIERFPIRIAEDGTFPAPQTWELNPDAYNYGETVANPDYVNAPIELAWITGADPYQALSVGAPPSEFASGKMSEKKFASLNWNGEVRLTDNLLVNYGSNNLDTNKYGEYLQLISDVTHGIIPVNRRHCFPMMYRRTRISTAS